MMLEFRQNKFPYERSNRTHRFSLGNEQTRYNERVQSERKRFFINSTRNSEDAPEWMSRTQSHYYQSSRKHVKATMFSNPESCFLQTKQKWVYADLHKKNNVGGQFECITPKNSRNKWHLHDNTFHFEWPKKAQAKMVKIQQDMHQNPKPNSFFSYKMPKYGIKESPLHRQKETPIKIGHKSMVDSTYIK